MLIFLRRTARHWAAWPFELFVLLGFVFAPDAEAFTPPTTTIQDTIYNADGTPFNGVLYISWPAFTASDTSVIGAQTISVPISQGYLTVSLVPTTTALTAASYTVLYESGGMNQYTEIWAVPPSSTPLRIQMVRVSTTQVTNVPPGASTGSLGISDITGLSAELNVRPTMGPSYIPLRAAVIDTNGLIDGASGNLSDCVHVDGSSGACGGTGTVTFVDSEVPAGVMNGTNGSFSLANIPAPSTSLHLFRNGLLLEPTVDYTLSNAAITFLGSSIPGSSDTLLASYRYGGTLAGVTFVDAETPSGSINGVNTTFTLATTPSSPGSVHIYLNGLRMSPGVDYTISGSTITFLAGSTPQTGDVLVASYRM